ncbi:IclR family transcriptional regulator [Amycolatopsis taiwanensis]|uniref:Glycerol operon regulatory protein n=1 Tax=Amycolatopsis taiwanensis TaxID=342230 RepID=A0A9W6R101_9PSEU|nr:IclR family transcriptional regulator [Amycolatopsis taiwanensis]GLY66373.1 IclR family transcriptional regulator [Amycolatopsis taiwanensis]
MARTGNPAVRQVEAVQRAIAVLDVLGEAGGELGTNEIARRTGINVSSVSRLLATLVDGGLAHHVPSTGRYRLGIRILQLARAVRQNLDIRDVARPYLVELSELTGETATLSLPGRHEVLTIDFVQSEASVRSVAAIGRNSVAHATAVGKVFLAWGGSLPEAELTAFTDRTVTDPAELARELDQVRRRGWAGAAGERERELNGIAAPVLDSGQLAAIIGLQGPAARFTAKPMRRAADLLIERAALIESVLQAG